MLHRLTLFRWVWQWMPCAGKLTHDDRKWERDPRHDKRERTAFHVLLWTIIFSSGFCSFKRFVGDGYCLS